jgi:outer membrane protein assembly factor BamB
MFNPRECSRQNIFLSFLVVASLLSAIANAAPSISLSKKSGPPTSKILVSGRGFKPHVGVDIFFDTKDKALVVTNGEGEFHDARIHAPRSARPGEHWVTALERNNDKGDQKPFLVQTDWTQFHFDADGTRRNPYENVLNPSNVGKLDLKWSFAADSDGVLSSPAVVDGLVYFGSSGVYALDARSGEKVWSYTTGIVGTSPAVANGMIYIGSWDYNLYGLNAHSGAKVWSRRLNAVYSSPAVANGVVYVGSADGKLYALNGRTGVLLWSYQTDDLLFSSPAVANGVVYFGAAGGNVYALNADTGAELWSFQTNNNVDSSPSVSNGVVYIAATDYYKDYNVYALNALTGANLWSYSTGEPAFSSPAVADGVVYLGSGSGIDALDAQTGALLWNYQTGGCCVSSAPAVANGVVYVGSPDGRLYALHARTGAFLWSYATGNDVASSPTVANGVVYVGSDDGNVYAFSPKLGATQTRASSKRPNPKTLSPDLNLQVSNREN